MPARTTHAWAFIRWPRAAGKVLALLLAMVLAMPPATAQSDSASGPAPSRLKIQVLTQAPLTEMAGTLSANTLQVRITDEWDMPVSGATVSFRLPEAGPGGVFLNGLSSEIALTDERGEAAILGFDWRKDAGVTFVHVIAAYKSVRAGAMVEVHLGRKVSAVPPAVANPAPAAPAREPANPSPPVLGQMASNSQPANPRDALLPIANRAPREETPTPPDSAYQPPMVRAKGKPSGQPSPEAGRDPASSAYVRTRTNGSRGGNKLMMLLLVAGAAAGGAIAVGMTSSSSGGSGGAGGGTVPPPVIRIGNPTITISGGN